MQTVANPQTHRKPTKAFYAHFDGAAGYLTKCGDALLFLAHGSTSPHVIVPADVWNLGFFARRLEKVYSRLTPPMPVEPGVGLTPSRSHAY